MFDLLCVVHVTHICCIALRRLANTDTRFSHMSSIDRNRLENWTYHGIDILRLKTCGFLD